VAKAPRQRAAKPIPVRPPLQRAANQSLARLLARRAKEQELSIRDLADALGVAPTTVHKTLRGQRRLDPFEFVDWCEALDLGDPVRVLASLTRRG
jgi:cyanate lyase